MSEPDVKKADESPAKKGPPAFVVILLPALIAGGAAFGGAKLAAAHGAPAQTIAAELRERDHRDRTRANSPLAAAEDAVVLDSTNMTEDEVLGRIEKLVEERVASRR